jgi:dTDP-4-dehydrorhamnose reductase
VSEQPPAIVIGSSGQVSRALFAALRGRELFSSSSSGAEATHRLDLGDPGSIREAFRLFRERLGPGKAEVFLAGAMTHVDKCEQEKVRCRQVNALGPAVVAEECRAAGYGLTYFSTEYVFGQSEYEGGKAGPFSEEDAPHPSSWYGECKLEAERSVQEFCREAALIVRTTMVFSWDPQGMNFLMQYLRQLDEKTRVPSFRIPIDQISTPTYAPWLAASAVSLRSRKIGGVFNLVGKDLLSRKELVERVAEAFGFGAGEAEKAFRFVKTAEMGQAARRPLTAGLRVDKAEAHGLKPLTLEEAFQDVKKLRNEEVGKLSR